MGCSSNTRHFSRMTENNRGKRKRYPKCPETALGYLLYSKDIHHFSCFPVFLRFFMMIFYPDLWLILFNRVVERAVRIRKAEGSIPFESTKGNSCHSGRSFFFLFTIHSYFIVFFHSQCQTEAPATDHHCHCEPDRAHPRVASLAPAGQFTFWQSPGEMLRKPPNQR